MSFGVSVSNASGSGKTSTFTARSFPDLKRFGQQRFRFGKDLAVKVVEAANDLARQFHVRDLILADRDVVGFVHANVSRLQHRVAEKGVVAEVFVADVLALLFVSRHSFEPTQRSDRRKID